GSLVAPARLDGDDLVADGDRAVREDVRVEPRAVDELLDDPRPRHLLEVEARLAEHDAVALDRADPELLPHEVVEARTRDRHLPVRRARLEAGPANDVALDQRQSQPRTGAVGEEVAVAVEPLAGDRVDD